MWCSHSQVDGTDLGQTTPPSGDLPSWTSKPPVTPAELDACLAQYERRAEEEEEDEDEEERVPDLQKDDMMARRTGVFHKQSTVVASFNRFLPLPASQRGTKGEVATDAAPRNKKEVQAERSKVPNVRWAEICVELLTEWGGTNKLGVARNPPSPPQNMLCLNV